MSEDIRARQPKGVPVGGQFSTTARAETGTNLDAAAPDRGAALRDLATSIVTGKKVIVNDREAAQVIVPNVPDEVLSEQLWHDVLVATLHQDDDAVDAAIARLVDMDAREARWRNNSDFIPPAFDQVDSGGTGPVRYTTTTGPKYTGYRDVTQVAKDVRTDLKVAAAAGYLPDEVTFSVTVLKYSGGQSLRVSIRGMADSDIYENDPVTWSNHRYSRSTNLLRKRVEGIAEAYTKNTTDTGTDYFNYMYYAHVSIEDESGATYRARIAANAKRKHGARAAAA